ncbi:MAG: LuxR C-terminal-related transcriptional regulator [Cyanobacteria bacterium J06623_4]
MSASQASQTGRHQKSPSIDEAESSLSKRELQIVELIAAGLTNQEISERLEISKRTVDNHVSNVLNKTATGNRVALVRWALQSGKVCIDELNCCHLPEGSLQA